MSSKREYACRFRHSIPDKMFPVSMECKRTTYSWNSAKAHDCCSGDLLAEFFRRWRSIHRHLFSRVDGKFTESDVGKSCGCSEQEWPACCTRVRSALHQPFVATKKLWPSRFAKVGTCAGWVVLKMDVYQGHPRVHDALVGHAPGHDKPESESCAERQTLACTQQHNIVESTYTVALEAGSPAGPSKPTCS